MLEQIVATIVWSAYGCLCSISFFALISAYLYFRFVPQTRALEIDQGFVVYFKTKFPYKIWKIRTNLRQDHELMHVKIQILTGIFKKRTIEFSVERMTGLMRGSNQHLGIAVLHKNKTYLIIAYPPAKNSNPNWRWELQRE